MPIPSAPIHHSSLVMLGLLIAFAVLHSGGASLRVWGEARIGARAWRLLFAALSIPAAVVVMNPVYRDEIAADVAALGLRCPVVVA